MPSHALIDWHTVSLARLAELEAVHAQATGSARGRRWGTTQLNRSLFVVLVAQFQGYCRRLHDQAVDVHIAAAVPGQQALLRALLTQGRKLDNQNPRRDALGSDFGRLGFRLIDGLKAAAGSAASDLDALENLIDFRNAIGHGDEARIAAIEALGQIKATKRSYQQFRRTIDRLAGTMDQVVATKLAAVLGITHPW
ncbi:MAG: hypothetical protein ACRD2W_08945 [Acidimicrobiales bacterium]